MNATPKSFVSFDKTEMYYEISHGSSKHKTLILLHGLTGDLTAWNEEIKKFQQSGYTTIAVDLRGHGLSGRPEEKNAYSLQNFAKDIYLLIKHEKIQKPIIIGHCFGGMVGIILTALHPHILKGLILIDTSYKLPTFTEAVTKHKSFQSFLHTLAKHVPRIHLQKHSNYKDFINTPDYDWKRILNDIAHVSLKSFLSISENLIEYNALSLLKKIRVPTLIVEGLNDSIFPPYIAEELHKRIIYSDLQLIKNANHILVLNNPKELSGTIINFLKKIHF